MNKEQNDLTAAKEFDEEALTAIFDHYAPVIYRYTLRLCGDATKADQIVGDVFSRLLDHMAAGKGPQTNLRSYLFQCAYHAIVDQSREEQRTAPLDIAENILENEKALPDQVEENILFEELQVAINRDLTEDQRHVVILRFQEEFSLRETAEIIGKNVNAIKALQTRAVERLRKSMNAKKLSDNQ